MRKPRYGQIFAGHDEGAEMAEHAAVLWELYKADLEGRGLWNGVRARTLDRLVRYSVEHDHYHPIVTAEGPVTVGPNGGDCANMKWTMVQKLADRVERLEETLTLTPKSAGEKIGTKKPQSKTTKADEYLNGQSLQ